jgi:hypothetical protein
VIWFELEIRFSYLGPRLCLHSDYTTHALEIDGVTVEIMGDIQKRLGDRTWEAPVDIRSHRRWVAIGDLRIPVLSLEYEYMAYLALGRAKQAEMLRTWLQEHEHANNQPRSK